MVAIGVVQEQHPDRTRLYRQWRQLDWPIFVDSLNVLDVEVVPIPIPIDESGIVRHRRIRPNQFAKRFVDVAYPKVDVPASYNRATKRDAVAFRSGIGAAQRADDWRGRGDAVFLHNGDAGVQLAIEAYENAVELNPSDGRAQFRLGVALRRRYDSNRRQPGDAQAAVERWGLALAVNPNQYIWRRRIQQYGPRLDKPYNFYFWIAEARKEIVARGETPVELAVEPSGSELAPPARRGSAESIAVNVSRDPDGRIQRDKQGMIVVDTMVTPARVQPGNRVRLRATFRVNQNTKPFWNNEADDLAVFLNLPEGTTLGEGTLAFPNPRQPETREDRLLEAEIVVGRSAKRGALEIPAYALYYVCENKGGKCRYLRQDFAVTVHVDPDAPKIR